jgi:RNA polymerase primary sigma factor
MNKENASLNKYLEEIGHKGLLTAEEESRLAQQASEGDEKALEQLVGANLRFVVSLASEYQGKGLDMEDLVNEGNIALVKAAKSFDPTRGTRLVVFAASRIRKAIEAALNYEEDNSKLKDLKDSYTPPISSDDADDSILEHANSDILSERERQVISAIYGINQPTMTLAEVGMQMDITRERARQIRDKALRKLRKQYKRR